MARKGIIKNGKNKKLHSKLIKQKKNKKREQEETRKERLKAIIKKAQESN